MEPLGLITPSNGRWATRCLQGLSLDGERGRGDRRCHSALGPAGTGHQGTVSCEGAGHMRTAHIVNIF